ncbi:hypothetical protein [Pseudomonas indica]|uniref:hypothetical protein n=1 Tax=Pseudomonas indica TaxID=137658 RepID=UPI003FD14C52
MTFLISGYMRSDAMATARDLFGSQSNQVLVKDEVAFKPARNPYQAIFEASERLNSGMSALLVNDQQRKSTDHDKDIDENGRVLPSHL